MNRKKHDRPESNSNRVPPRSQELPPEPQHPPTRAIRIPNPEATVYHAFFDTKDKWPTAICVEFDVVAQGTSREAAMDNLEAAIEDYLGIAKNTVRVVPATKKQKDD